jgi:hypothetical protein
MGRVKQYARQHSKQHNLKRKKSKGNNRKDEDLEVNSDTELNEVA